MPTGTTHVDSQLGSGSTEALKPNAVRTSSGVYLKKPSRPRLLTSDSSNQRHRARASFEASMRFAA